MKQEDSPFTPNQPVDIDFFTGREEHIKELAETVSRAAAGNMQTAWIAGERGIGKSSLAAFVGFLTEQDNHALVAHVHLGGVHELSEMVKKSYLSLLKDNQRKSWGENLLGLFEGKIKQVGIFGVEMELNMPPPELEATANNFAESLNQIIENSSNDRKVLLLILDDINGLANTARFADWFKSMVDSVATRRLKTPICLFFVGLQERLENMRANNPSVIRCFNKIVEITPWTDDETENFFTNAFDKKNVAITPANIELLVACSGGLPTVAHEIGDQIWRVAVENEEIEERYIVKGITEAAYSIGRRFIESEVVQALGSKNYKSILKKIGGAHLDVPSIFSRKDLLSLAALRDQEKKTLDNFLRRMVKVGGLQTVERGLYRFPTYMHRMYFWLKAKAPRG